MRYGRDTERDATHDGLLVLRVGDAREGKEKPWLLIRSTAGSSSRDPRTRVARQGAVRPLPRRHLSGRRTERPQKSWGRSTSGALSSASWGAESSSPFLERRARQPTCPRLPRAACCWPSARSCG